MADPGPADGDDSAYLWYVAAALGAELAGGLLIGVLIYLARSGIVLRDCLPELIQAHGWLQLQGWAGLFVAGMAQRLVPRLAGRAPAAAANLPLFLLLLAGAVLRPIGQVVGGSAGGAIVLVASLSAAIGSLGLSVVLASVLLRARSPRAGWLLFAWAGCAWWTVWAVLDVWAGVLGAGAGGLVPGWLDEPSVWVVTLGSIGSFIWAIQSRMVPIFFGRRPPGIRALAGPAIAYNLGVLLVLASVVPPATGKMVEIAGEAVAVGLGLAGLGLIWLAIAGGSVAGAAHRLRAASRSLARYVVSANRWSIVAGLMLLGALADPLAYSDMPRHSLDDAALHAFGSGVITMLIAGMVQMVSPVFARARMDAPSPGVVEKAIWPLLWGATAARVAAALADGYGRGQAFTVLAAISGALGWLGLAALAAILVRARTRYRAATSSSGS